MRDGKRRGAARAALGACALLAAAPSSAAAQTGADYAGFAGTPWQIGGFVFVTPKYEGSKSYRALGFPFIAPAGLGQDGGAIDIRGAENVRLRLLHQGGFEAGVLGGYRFGRDEDDGARLVGLGDIDGGFVAGGYAGYRAGSLFFSASYHHQITGDDTGGVVQLAVDHTMRLDSRTKLVTTLGTSYASDDYMSSFFSVPVGPLAPYDASAGFKDVSIGTTATIDLDPRWTLYLTGRYTRLIGDAADSPLVETENGFFGGAGLSYKFNWTR